MSLENIQYVVHSKGSLLVSQESPKPTISAPTEVVIRLKAIAINPADYKMIDLGLRITSWPVVPGLDGAGVVEAIGDGVTNFAVGDEVLANFLPGNRTGSYQHFAVVQESAVAKKPASLSFEDAASLGVSYQTALTSFAIGLKTPIPFVKDGPRLTFKPSSVLVLGGSSAVGAATIQLLRIAIPDCKILTTASQKHHDLLLTLGVDKAFDRNSTSLVEDVKNSTHGGVEAIIDAVGAGSTERHVFEIFDPNGPKRYAQVWTGDDEIRVPSGVDSVLFRMRDLSGMEGKENIMLGLQTLLEENKFRPALPVRKAGERLEGLRAGLDLVRAGVSGEKIVVGI